MTTWRLTLVVDPTRCDGRGVCAELLPEWITTDRWGYPILPSADLPGELVGHAELAIDQCPRMALHLVEGGR